MTEPEKPKPSLLDGLWVRLLVASWMLGIVIIYYRQQIHRLLDISGGR
jgi:hypothetical protein